MWEDQSVQRELNVLPVLPEQHQEGHAHAGERHVEPAAQQRRGELRRSGDAHQQDGGDGQHDVDESAQQDLGVSVFQLDRLLLLLLLQLQLGDAGLARLQDLLHIHQVKDQVRNPSNRWTRNLYVTQGQFD